METAASGARAAASAADATPDAPTLEGGTPTRGKRYRYGIYLLIVLVLPAQPAPKQCFTPK